MHTRKWIGNKTSVWAALMTAALLLVLLVNAQRTQAALIANKAQNGGLETGTTTGWSAVGSAVISATYLPAYEGSYSLHVDARTAPEDGAKQSLTSALTNGKTYAISAWVKLGAGESPAEIRMRLLKTANGNTTEQLQASATGSDGQWVKLEGSYTLNAPGALPALDLIFYAGNGTADFYIDSLRIVEQLTGIYNPLNTANVTALNADTVRLLTTNDGLALNMNTLREADQWQVESAGGNYTYNQNAQYGNRVSRPAVAGSEAWTNYKLSARMKPTATSTFASFALTARAGANGSLQAKYDFAQKKLSIFRFYNGVGYELASKTYTISLNQTVTFEFNLNGSQISLSVDGTPQLSAQDNFVVSGGIALTAFSTTMTFDNIQVVDLGTNSTLFSDNFEDGDSAGWTVASSVPQLFQQLNDWYNAGIPVIFSLTWTRSGKGYIPEGQERVDALQLVDDFLADWGSKIAVFVVENEPMFGYVTPGHKSVNAQGNIPAIEWFKALAAQAQATKAQHSGLSGLLVSSGSVDWALERKHNELDAVNTQFFDAEIDWINSDSHIDMVDLHLHVADLAEMNETIDYLKQRTGKPLISTEWSQAHLLKPWLTQTINS
ncbi:MAG: hypothetical protein K0Q59_367, partial [Paenibacillus sp.]|nr:hypothetical protein [Paenibacillus sp.]